MTPEPVPAEWTPVADERRAAIEQAMVARGTFARASQLFDDLEAGTVQDERNVVDLDELRARFG